MSDWFFDYHQVLQFRLVGMTMLLGMFGVCNALGYGLRIGCRTLAGRISPGTPIWQRRTP
ncbi:MAG TPA: hypothetical protein VKI44_01960 [Acetobacteraceae bacterium]|nr:hypothetical protein [Acetobacteraceae bacterium]